MTHRLHVSCLVAGFTLILAVPSLLGQCESLTKWGIWEEQRNFTDDQKAESFLSWLYQHQFSSYKEAHDASIAAGVNLDVLTGSLGVKSDDSSWRQFESELSSYEARQSYARRVSQTYNKTASRDVLKTVSDCLSAPGVHAWLVTTRDKSSFIIRTNYNSNSRKYPVADLLDFGHPASVTCPTLESKKRKPVILPGIHEHRCQRTTLDAVTLTLDSDPAMGGDRDLSLPSLQLEAPPSQALPVLLSEKSEYCSDGSNHCSQAPRDRTIRVDLAMLSVRADGTAILSFRSSAMQKFSAPSPTHDGPWVGLALLDGNGAYLTSFQDHLQVVEASVDACGGSQVVTSLPVSFRTEGLQKARKIAITVAHDFRPKDTGCH